jgi:hypothetical protein
MSKRLDQLMSYARKLWELYPEMDDDSILSCIGEHAERIGANSDEALLACQHLDLIRPRPPTLRTGEVSSVQA